MRPAVRFMLSLSVLVAVACHEPGVTNARLPVASLAVRAPADSLFVADSTRLLAATRAPDGEFLTDRPVTWSSSAPPVASVSNTGAVVALATGQAWIAAECEGLRDSVLIRALARVARLQLSPRSVTTVAGLSASISATLFDSAGNVITGRLITWTSLAPDTAPAGPSGGVIGKRPGTARIVASSEGHADTVSVTVLPRITSIVVGPTVDTLTPGNTWQLTATGRDTFGTIVPRGFRWTADSIGVGRVDTNGLVRTWGIGTLRVTATADGYGGTATIGTAPAAFSDIQAGLTPTGSVSGNTWCASTSAGYFCRNTGNYGGLLGNPNVPLQAFVGSAVVQVASPPQVRLLAKPAWQACVLTTSDTAWCWGGNSVGQPTLISGGISFATIESGRTYTCGISRAAEGWCWGGNSNGQLGTGNTTNSATPVKVVSPVALMAISTSGLFSCALSTDSIGYCWGDNFAGRLGDGTANTIFRRTPAPMAGGLHFASISLGEQHGCALTAAGAAWCWGSDQFGQLGNASVTTQDSLNPCPAVSAVLCRGAPVPVTGAPSLSELRSGPFYTCGLATDQSVWCWGLSTVGGNHAQPVHVVATSLKFTTLTAGETVCGMATDGYAYCLNPTTSETPVRAIGQR